MTIANSGAISFSDIQTEFGGSNPIGLDEYYAGGGLVPSGTSGTNGAVPSSGALGMQIFFGTSNQRGFFYSMPTLTTNYTPEFRDVQPMIGGGWMVTGTTYSGQTGQRFVAVLNASGAITSIGQSFETKFMNSMNMGGASAVSGNLVASYFGQGPNYFGAISPGSGGTTAVAGGSRQIIPSNVFPNLCGVDTGTGTVFSSARYQPNPEAADVFYYFCAHNINTGAEVYNKQATNSTIVSFEQATSAAIKSGDTSNVWLDCGGYRLMALNKTTGAFVEGYTLGNTIGGGQSYFTDSSGNFYFGNTTGDLRSISISSGTGSVRWSWKYSDSGTSQNWGYMQACFYNGAIYATGSQHPNGVFLTKIDPSNGIPDWSVKMPGLYGARGIAASADGILFTAETQSIEGARTTYLINYPLAGGVTGTYSGLQFSSMSTNYNSLNATVSTIGSGPTFTNRTGSAGGGTSLGSFSSPFGTKNVF